MKIKTVYLGSPDFSADFLEKILTSDLGMGIVAIVTQPDRPVGRKKILTPTPVKLIAQKYNIPVYEDLDELNSFDFDMGLVFAYSKFIPKKLLDKPKYGFINIHPSLLPLYRGPSPIAYPLINGDTKTGVTIIKLDEKMDHGDILAQEEIEIDENIKRPDLEKKLTNLALSVMLSEWSESKHPLLRSVPQEHNRASYTKLLAKEMGFVKYEDLTNGDQIKIWNLYRGLYPWPGIWTKINVKGEEKRMKITDLELKDSKLIIKKIQIEGEKERSFKLCE